MSAGDRITQGAMDTVEGTGKGLWNGATGWLKGGLMGAVVIGALGALVIGGGLAAGFLLFGMIKTATALGVLGALVGGVGGAYMGGMGGSFIGGAKGVATGFTEPFRRSSDVRAHQQAIERSQEIAQAERAVAMQEQEIQSRIAARNAAAAGFNNPNATTGHVQRTVSNVPEPVAGMSKV